MRIAQRVAAVCLAGALSVSLAVAASAARAQNRQNRAPAAAIPQIWINRLNLTADQQSRVQAASDAYRADMEKSRSLISADEKRTAARQARQTYQRALVAVLTPAQQDQLKAMRAQAREYHDLGPMANQLAVLNLSAEQQEKVKGIADRYRPKLQDLRTSLRTAADKKPVRDQMRDLRQQMTTEVKAVLTPDQLAQLPAPARRRALR